jgi:hypothetical protein
MQIVFCCYTAVHMDQVPRHQCLIYTGAPSVQLPALAGLTRQKLEQSFRCLYLNSPVMVAGMRSYLAAAGVDVAAETAKANLVMSSERHHLLDGRWFNVDRMMQGLEQALEQALNDGYAGLWATGDMTWEFGPEKGSMKLLEYEWRLEEFFHSHPQLEGVCQYHVDTLPEGAGYEAILAHPAIFVNQTLSLLNPHFAGPHVFRDDARENPALTQFMGQLLGGSEAS